MEKNVFAVFIVILFTVVILNAETTLNTGDVAFIGVNSDGDDDFAFVLLKPIVSGTIIKITDKGWNDSSGFYSVPGDGIWKWTATNDMDAGSIIHVKTTNNGILEPGCLETSIGTISWIEDNSTIISFQGEQIFLYQGTEADPTIITGVHWNVESSSSSGNWDGSASSAKTSALPNQLTNGVNAIWLYAAGPVEKDNFRYNGSTNSGTPSTLRSAINNLSNWQVDATNTTAYTLNPFLCTFTVDLTILPTVVTNSITNYDAVSATMGGNISDNGGGSIEERGVVYSSTDTTPEIGDTGVTKNTNTSGLDNFSESISGLSPGTTYYVQAYATNSAGSSYGGVENFTTLFPGLWTGATSTDWNTGSNWEDGTVPTSTIDVTITADCSNYPVIDGDIACKNFTIENGGSVQINSNHSLSVAGDFTLKDGGSFINNGILQFRGSDCHLTDNRTSKTSMGNVNVD